MSGAVWEAEVPNGSYSVMVSVGDSKYAQYAQAVTVEGTVAVSASTAANEFASNTVSVIVTDGKLTVVLGTGAGITCLNYISIAAE